MGIRAILTGVTVSLVASGVTNAADIKGPGGLKDVPYVETAWNWTGFYGGVTAGYGWGTSATSWTTAETPATIMSMAGPRTIRTAPFSAARSAIIINGRRNWVVGAEADMSWSGMEGQQHKYIYDGHDWSGGWDGLATIRGRVGYAIGPHPVLRHGRSGPCPCKRSHRRQRRR